MIKKIYDVGKNKQLEYRVFQKWSKDPKLIHGFTTKKGGVSKGEWASLNLGFNRGDTRENVIENYKLVCRALGVAENSLVAANQVHETCIVEVNKSDCGNGIHNQNKWASADGLYTKEKNITLVTYYADCVPLFFYAPKYEMIGLAHAGWRGTVGEIGAKMVKKWHEFHHIPYDEIEVGIGPSIGPCCFEVHDDVAHQFIKKFGKADFVVENKENGKYNINLWQCNVESLVKQGIKRSQITSAKTCTCCHHDIFFSHRYTQGKRGNLGAFMTLK